MIRLPMVDPPPIAKLIHLAELFDLRPQDSAQANRSALHYDSIVTAKGIQLVNCVGTTVVVE